jgi:glycerophosphoryl diester phosphodiesterase
LSRRHLIWVLAVAAVVGALLLLMPRRAAPDLHTAYFDPPRPLVIAHQGGDGLLPGNTLEAFRHAVTLGVDVLEMDVHRTRDGTWVVMHDATVDRTTNGSGALANLTLADVQTLDAAHHWPYVDDDRPHRGRGIGVPTVEAVLREFPELRFNIEIKPDSAAAGTAFCDELRRLEAGDRVLVASFHRASLRGFREGCPNVPTSAHEGEVRWFYLLNRLGLARVAGSGPAAFQLPRAAAGFDLADPGFIAAARQHGLHLDYWTINDRDAMRELVDRGADGIITDRPDLLLEVLGRAAPGRDEPLNSRASRL